MTDFQSILSVLAKEDEPSWAAIKSQPVNHTNTLLFCNLICSMQISNQLNIIRFNPKEISHHFFICCMGNIAFRAAKYWATKNTTLIMAPFLPKRRANPSDFPCRENVFWEQEKLLVLLEMWMSHTLFHKYVKGDPQHWAFWGVFGNGCAEGLPKKSSTLFHARRFSLCTMSEKLNLV